MNIDQIERPITGQSLSQNPLENDTYLGLLKANQDHARVKWTTVTYFMSLSFALFGISFPFSSQGQAVEHTLLIRVSALSIYWFTFLLFLHFQAYSELLVTAMKKMETTPKEAKPVDERLDEKETPRTTIRIYTQEGKGFIYRILTSRNLLVYFGMIYTVAVVLLWYYGR